MSLLHKDVNSFGPAEVYDCLVKITGAGKVLDGTADIIEIKTSVD